MASSPAKEVKAEKSPVLIRPARLFSSDSAKMGEMAYTTYLTTALALFLSPRCVEYKDTSIRGYTQRIAGRMCSPRNVSLVAYPASNPEQVVGYIQFLRLGDDFPPRHQQAGIVQGAQWWIYVTCLGVVAWMLKFWIAVVNWVEPDLGTSKENLAKFESWVQVDEKRYWDEKAFPARKERWHVQSCVVGTEWQRRGIGRRLMEDVIMRAKEEGMCVGLEATAAGSNMYKSVAFEKIGDFSGDVLEEGGGVYMWKPEGFKESRVDDHSGTCCSLVP